MAENTFRYTKVDYASHRDALIQRVRGRWSQVWNDFSSNNIAMMLVDLIAWTTATWAFLINRAAAEQYIPTMTLRESAVRIGALTGYKLRGPVPATLLCEAELSTAASGNSSDPIVKIPKGTAITVGEDNLIFEVQKDYFIYGGQTTPVEQIATLDAKLSGAKVISSNVKVANGATYIDLIDTTIDISQYVQVGQTVRLPRPSPDTKTYIIQGFETPPGSTVEHTRILISPAWSSNVSNSAETVAIEVIERRIALIQGQTLTDRFVAPAIETKNHLIRLSQTPVIDKSITASVNGEPWEEVESLSAETEKTAIFEVRTTATGITTLRFGDGVFGQIVPTDAVILVTYRVGGGADGNVGLNSLSSSMTGFLVSASNPVQISIRNATSSGQGGRDPETLEEARANIPYYTRTNDRAVTLEDWQALARGYSHPSHGSVAYARASVRTENALLEGNLVYVYAWTTGPDGSLVPLSSQLKTALREFLATKALGTDYPIVADGTERPAPISLRFKVVDGFSVLDTQKLVKEQIRKIVTALRPGSPILHSNLLRAIDEVSGVDTVSMATPISDLQASNPSELFTNPKDDYLYAVDRTFKSGTSYTAQLPVSPLAAWSFKMFLGTKELTVVPDTEPGYARLFGEGLDSATKSTVNLLTGQTTLALVGSPGDLAMQLVPVAGYNQERTVDVYVGYVGLNTAEKRAEIRAALRAWAEGIRVGGPMFADEVSGITESKSNIKAVVQSILDRGVTPGTSVVNRVALSNPANTDVKVTASEFELLRIGSIVLNNKQS